MFHLSKWYLDCVTDGGDAAVLYWASLRWGLIRLRYGAALCRLRRGGRMDRYTLRPGAAPARVDQDGVHWSSEVLEIEGTWAAGANGVRHTLLDGASGTVDWHCIRPKADVHLQVGDHAMRGLGYVEHLTMSVKPWQLPFRELTWGRFHSSDDHLVWIKWEGQLSRSWAFLNGVESGGGEITSRRVALPDASVALDLEVGRPLRSGRVADTAMGSLRAAASLLPRWGRAHESKWIARGRLVTPSGGSAGWALHEKVRW